MPRQARQHGEAGLYHILFQGPPGRPPFWEANDREFFVQLMKDKRLGGEYCLYAYCVLPDCAYLLIRQGRAGVERITKRLGISYARYYQKKYAWTGKVFHDRYKSQSIQEGDMVRAVICHIHAMAVNEQAVSSAGLYIDLVQGMMILPEIFSLLETADDPFVAAAQLIKTKEPLDGDCFLTVSNPFALQEAEAAARWRMQQFLTERQLTEVELKQRCWRRERRQVLEMLAEDERLSGRHLAKITGLNRETVRIVLGTILAEERNM